jgi:hypothetical protein
MTVFVIGDRVRCERQEPSRGTWPRYDGKTGVVTDVIQTIRERGSDDRLIAVGEVGVRLQGKAPTLWFRASELVKTSK